MPGQKIYQKIPYIIAECAYSYEGDIAYLKESVRKIAETDSIDAVKFHILLDMDSYMCADHEVYDLLKPWLFAPKKWQDIIDYAKSLSLEIVVLADDLSSLPFLKSIEDKLAAVEIHACSLNDTKMLEKVAKFKIPVILGIGGSTIEEITFAIDFLKKEGKTDIILMYGFQNFPTKYEYINLKKMRKIKDLFKLPVGYADHTSWDNEYQELITLAGFLLSDGIVEKHFVLKKGEKRTDSSAALSVEDFKSLGKKIDVLQKALGTGTMKLNKYEMDYAKIGFIKKAIIAGCDIKKNEKITKKNTAFKRTRKKSDIMQKEIVNILGRKAKEKIARDELITFDNTY